MIIHSRYDSLTIHDGSSSASPVIGNKLCGDLTDIVSDIESTSSAVFIQFKTDGSVTKSGFEIEYSVVGDGVIESPGYPLEYANNLDKTWLIEVQPGEKVLIKFVSFTVEKSSNCV